MGDKPECFGCKNYYIYYSRKDRNYVITEHAGEAFDNSPWISLEDRCVPDLIKLLQNHESLLEDNKANLSEEEFVKKATDPERLKKFSKIINKILSKGSKTP
jgi:hypothetical protein